MKCGFTLSPASAQQSVPAEVGSPSGPGAEVLARGRYMIVTGHCNNCHTADYQQRAGKVPDKDWLTGTDVGRRGPQMADIVIDLNRPRDVV